MSGRVVQLSLQGVQIDKCCIRCLDRVKPDVAYSVCGCEKYHHPKCLMEHQIIGRTVEEGQIIQCQDCKEQMGMKYLYEKKCQCQCTLKASLCLVYGVIMMAAAVVVVFFQLQALTDGTVGTPQVVALFLAVALMTAGITLSIYELYKICYRMTKTVKGFIWKAYEISTSPFQEQDTMSQIANNPEQGEDKAGSI